MLSTVPDRCPQTHVLEKLTPYTEYLIKIQVKNMMGVGPFAVVRETTLEGGTSHQNLLFL